MVDVVYESIVGRRKTNEDTIDIHKNGTHTFIGVYDGHGGCTTSTLLKEKMYEILSNNITHMDVTRAIRKTYDDVDRLCSSHIGVGSTVVIAFITDTDIYISNVGDSQAMIVSDGKIEVLSTIHNEDNVHERNRVHGLGGWFEDGYVCSTLNMTRCIGDRDITPFIIHTPSIRRIERRDGLLILGSDGLFDHIDHNEILSICKSNTLIDIPYLLVQKAYDNGSYDNITVVVCKV